MADRAPSADQSMRGGRGRGRGRGFGDRGRGDRGRGDRGDRGRGRGRGRGGRRGPEDEKEWVPVTKLGRLVKDHKITSLEQIFLYGLPIKEPQIIDALFPPGKLKEEMLKISPVQKQTSAGQRTRFKAYVLIGDEDGHLGLGEKVGREVATAIRGATVAAKLAMIPVRRGYWGEHVGMPYTVAMKVTGKSGSVTVRLMPAPRGTGIVAAPLPKKILLFAGVSDCHTVSRGNTKTMGNFALATFFALQKTYALLTPDLWKSTPLRPTPYQEFAEYLKTTGGMKA